MFNYSSWIWRKATKFLLNSNWTRPPHDQETAATLVALWKIDEDDYIMRTWWGSITVSNIFSDLQIVRNSTVTNIIRSPFSHIQNHVGEFVWVCISKLMISWLCAWSLIGRFLVDASLALGRVGQHISIILSWYNLLFMFFLNLPDWSICIYSLSPYIHITDDYLSKNLIVLKFCKSNNCLLQHCCDIQIEVFDFVIQSLHLLSVCEEISDNWDAVYIMIHTNCDTVVRFCLVLVFVLWTSCLILKI